MKKVLALVYWLWVIGTLPIWGSLAYLRGLWKGYNLPKQIRRGRVGIRLAIVYFGFSFRPPVLIIGIPCGYAFLSPVSPYWDYVAINNLRDEAIRRGLAWEVLENEKQN